MIFYSDSFANVNFMQIKEQTATTNTGRTEIDQPLVKTIGKTTYLVTCHFSETSKETLQDKIKRMILRDIQSGIY